MSDGVRTPSAPGVDPLVTGPTEPIALQDAPRPLFLHISAGLGAALVVGAWWTVLDAADLDALFSARTWRETTSFVAGLFGSLEPFTSVERWRFVAGLAAKTVAMSVIAIGIAAAGMLLTVIPGARWSPTGEGLRARSVPSQVLFFGVRGVYALTRAVPELIWAMLLVLVFTAGLLPGAIALGIHNVGILGKLCAEVVENLDARPARALRAAGARGFQVLAYGVLPQALPQFLTYTLYRWEVVIRTTIVVGFVGAGGLGREFQLSMSFFHYPEVLQLLLVYLFLVLGVDAVSALLRKLAK